MRVLFLSHSLNTIGGIQSYNRSFLIALKELSIDYRVIEAKKTSMKEKIRIGLLVGWHTMMFRPNLLICSHVSFSFIGYIIQLLFRTPFAVIGHGIEVWNLTWLEKILLSQCSLVTVSRFTKDSLHKQLGEARSISIIPNIIDLPAVLNKSIGRNLKKLRTLHSGKRIILTVARMDRNEQYKGYDRIIECMPHLLKKHPDICFVSVGDGTDRNRIESIIQQLHLDRAVYLPGFVSDDELEAYYRLCTLFILPSSGEGFGIVLLEALNHGKPVIAGRGGACDPLQDGRTGILINPNSTEELYTAIDSVLSMNVRPDLLNPSYLFSKTQEKFARKNLTAALQDFLGRCQK